MTERIHGNAYNVMPPLQGCNINGMRTFIPMVLALQASKGRAETIGYAMSPRWGYATDAGVRLPVVLALQASKGRAETIGYDIAHLWCFFSKRNKHEDMRLLDETLPDMETISADTSAETKSSPLANRQNPQYRDVKAEMQRIFLSVHTRNPKCTHKKVQVYIHESPSVHSKNPKCTSRKSQMYIQGGAATRRHNIAYGFNHRNK